MTQAQAGESWLRIQDTVDARQKLLEAALELAASHYKQRPAGQEAEADAFDAAALCLAECLGAQVCPGCGAQRREGTGTGTGTTGDCVCERVMAMALVAYGMGRESFAAHFRWALAAARETGTAADPPQETQETQILPVYAETGAESPGNPGKHWIWRE